MTTDNSGEITAWDKGDLFVVLEPIGYVGHDTLLRVLEEHGIRLGVYDSSRAAKAELKKQLVERGIGSILSAVRLQEDVIPKDAEPDAYSAAVAAMVDHLAPAQVVRLHDPYLLTPGSHGPARHAELIVLALEPALKTVATVAFYYDKINQEAEDALAAALRGAGFQGEVSFTRVRDIHDRMLIVDDDRGLMMGSSFNSVGKRYFLLDYLRGNDGTTLARLLSANPDFA